MSTDLFGVRVLDVDKPRRRVRFRVFVVYYEPSWGTNELLPDDASFIMRALWDGTCFKGTLLQDLVSTDEILDESWVDTQTGRFIAGVETVATRNHPLDAAAWDRLHMFYYERDGAWKDEHLLAQGDYEIQVTDARWLDGLRPGDAWGTTSYSTKADPLQQDDAEAVEAEYLDDAADGDAHAAFVLGWMRQERGDLRGAEQFYRDAADGDDPDERIKALLYLGRLYDAQDDLVNAYTAYEDAMRSEDVGMDICRSPMLAAIGLGDLWRRDGAEDKALDAYAHAEELAGDAGELDLVRQARLRAGIETWTDKTARLLDDSGPDAARRYLSAACGSEVVAGFGVSLAQRETAAALASLNEVVSSDVDLAAAVALGFAATRTFEPDAMREALDLVVATGAPVAGYRRAVTETLIDATDRSEEAVRELYWLLRDRKDVDGLDVIVEFAAVAESHHPGVAAKAFNLLGTTDIDRGDLAAAATWLERGAGLADASEDATSAPAFNLGVVRRKQGDLDAAREAFTKAEAGYVLIDKREMAARSLGTVLDRQGDWEAASAAWVRAAFLKAQTELEHDDHARWSVHSLGERLAAAGEADAARQAYQLGSAAAKAGDRRADTYATFYFAHWIKDGSHHELARCLLETIADDAGPHATRAMLTLGAVAYEADDDDTACAWWRRARKTGKSKTAHSATMNLMLVAQKNRDLPETLRLMKPIAASRHRDAALAAGFIGEMYYWHADADNAIAWYQKTLDGTDDPGLVGEAAYRIGELLHSRAGTEAARPYLDNAAASGGQELRVQGGIPAGRTALGSSPASCGDQLSSKV